MAHCLTPTLITHKILSKSKILGTLLNLKKQPTKSDGGNNLRAEGINILKKRFHSK